MSDDPIVVKVSPNPTVQVVKIVPTSGQVVSVKAQGIIPTPAEIGAYTTEQVDTLIANEQSQIGAAQTANNATQAQLDQVAAQVTEKVLQFPAPSTQWTIVHNLGKLRPTVTIVDTAGDEIATDIRPVDANTVLATFAAPTAGTAYVN